MAGGRWEVAGGRSRWQVARGGRRWQAAWRRSLLFQTAMILPKSVHQRSIVLRLASCTCLHLFAFSDPAQVRVLKTVAELEPVAEDAVHAGVAVEHNADHKRGLFRRFR